MTILTVLSQFLWNLTFIFLDSGKKSSLKVKGFCPLKIKITLFPNGFCLKVSSFSVYCCSFNLWLTLLIILPRTWWSSISESPCRGCSNVFRGWDWWHSWATGKKNHRRRGHGLFRKALPSKGQYYNVIFADLCPLLKRIFASWMV